MHTLLLTSTHIKAKQRAAETESVEVEARTGLRLRQDFRSRDPRVINIISYVAFN